MTTRSTEHIFPRIKKKLIVMHPFRSNANVVEAARLFERVTGDNVRIVQIGKFRAYMFEVERWTGTRWVKG